MAQVIDISCNKCGFAGKPDQFPVNNEQYTCPQCKTDESGLDIVRLGSPQLEEHIEMIVSHAEKCEGALKVSRVAIDGPHVFGTQGPTVFGINVECRDCSWWDDWYFKRG